jgi:hypothetical protein
LVALGEGDDDDRDVRCYSIPCESEAAAVKLRALVRVPRH